MAKYYLWMKQTDYGCGYTIGCGEKLVPLKVEDLSQAANAVLETLEECGINEGERCLADALILEESASAMTLVQRHLEQRARKNEDAQRIKDEVELKRLQEKLKK